MSRKSEKLRMEWNAGHSLCTVQYVWLNNLYCKGEKDYTYSYKKCYFIFQIQTIKVSDTQRTISCSTHNFVQ